MIFAVVALKVNEGELASSPTSFYSVNLNKHIPSPKNTAHFTETEIHLNIRQRLKQHFTLTTKGV